MIYPKEIIEDTSEANFHRHSTRSQLIYFITLLFIFSILVLLPWIQVEVGVKSRGMIRPDLEKVRLFAPVTGIVEELRVRENELTESGNTIAIIDPGSIYEKLEYAQQRMGQVTGFISDLEELTGSMDLRETGMFLPEEHPGLDTDRYRRSLHEYQLRLAQAHQDMKKTEREWTRSSFLSGQELISDLEHEENEFSFAAASRHYRLLQKQQIHRWTLDKTEFLNEQNQLRLEIKDLRRSLDDYKIQAPVSGSIQNLSGVQSGSFIFQNQVIAEISPDTDLIAELHVSPEDIGLLSEGMPVRMQIDAYHHNQWGIVSGSIIEIPDDYDQVDSLPVFKVRCRLDHTFLKLSNGYRGELKKGMTLQGRFIIAERSLFQLLHDKMDDWLNPVWS